MRIGAGKEPKVQLSRLVRVLGDGQQAGIRLANVKSHLWNGRSIDHELFSLLVEELGLASGLQKWSRRGGRGSLLIIVTGMLLVEGIQGTPVETCLGHGPKGEKSTNELELHGEEGFGSVMRPRSCQVKARGSL